MVVVVLSDHGEGLGDHGEHGARHLPLPRGRSRPAGRASARACREPVVGSRPPRASSTSCRRFSICRPARGRTRRPLAAAGTRGTASGRRAGVFRDGVSATALWLERAAGDERRAVSLCRGPARGAVRSRPRSGRATQSGRRATRNGRGNAHLDLRPSRWRGRAAAGVERSARASGVARLRRFNRADGRRPEIFPIPRIESAATSAAASAGGARPRRSRGRDRAACER